MRGPVLALLGVICLVALLLVALKLRGDADVTNRGEANTGAAKQSDGDSSGDSLPIPAATAGDDTADTHTADTHTADTHTADTHTAGTHSADAHTADAYTADGTAVAEHAAAASDPPVRTDVVPVWDERPQPQLALLVTGEQHGFFEPCGCTSNQMGGMSRRANLAKKMKDAGWNVLGVDLGGLARRSVRQAQIKFETTAAALRELDYVATGLGPEDLRLSPDFLLSQHLPEGNHPLHFVSANLVFFDAPDIGTPVPHVIVQENGVTLGITSVLSESLKQTVLAEGANLNMSWSEPAPAMEKALAAFSEAGVTFRILLSHGSLDESRELAERFPQFDVVVAAEGPGDPDPTAAPEKVGDTLLLMVGRKGKYTGALGIYPNDADARVRFQLIPLERSAFDETDSMIRLMRNYQERLKDEEIVLAEDPKLHPSGAFFVGSGKCGECHTTAFDIWAESGHAHALESLDPRHQRLGYERLNGVERMFDPECLACHVTGWDPQEYFRYDTGFLNEEFAATEEQRQLHAIMAGSGCENCHGPGSRHIELIEADELDLARQEVRVTLQQAKDTMCYKCHDTDNSPNFDFDEYWPKVEHKGLD